MTSAEPFAPPNQLLPTAVSHLSHDLRGALHVIRGHAELLGAETESDDTRESANEIMIACRRLGGLCDDIVDFLRLPAVAPGALVDLALVDLARAVGLLATGDRARVRFVVPPAGHQSMLVQAAVRRVLAHALEHLARTAVSNLTIVAALRGPELCEVVISPVPKGVAARDDGVIAVCAAVLAAHRGRLSVLDDGIELMFPVVGSLS